ncbi:MAG: hypothetical protein D6760_01795 [Deltaproteobacteria bacterium]|nr:MAG: hypothetical protein D6760_01795 [Deltaproteobacteria bacterium]
MGKRIVAVHLTSRDIGLAVAETSLRSLRVAALERNPLGEPEAARIPPELRPDVTIASLPATALLFRILEFPFGDRRRLDQAVGPALEEHLPLALDDCRSAYDLVSEQRPFRVLAGMIPRHELEERCRRLEALGLAPARVVWAPSAALSTYAAALTAQYPDAIVIHCDGDAVVVAAFSDGRLSGLRIHPTCDTERLVRNIAWTIRTFENSAREVFIGGIGAGRLSEALAAAVTEKTIAAAADQPPPLQIPATEDWTAHATSLGLVMAAGGQTDAPALTFPVAPEMEPAAGRWRELRPLAAWGAAAVVFLLLAFVFDTARLSRRAGALEAEADRIVRQVLPAAAGAPGRRLKLELRAAELERRLGAGAAPGGVSALGTLAALSQAVPKQVGVEFDFYLYDPPEVRVRGHGNDFEDVTKLERALEASEAVESVEANNVRAAVSGGGVDFDLTIHLATEEERS